MSEDRTRQRLARALSLAALPLLLACEPRTERRPPVQPQTEAAIQALVFSRTVGFRHASIEDAKRFLSAIPAQEGIACTITEDPSQFTDATLARFDLVVFANTTGDVLDAEQQAALERFLRAGKGFVGVHAAADTEHDWPFYRELLGASFVSHPPATVELTVTVEHGGHPATAHLDPRFRFEDEWYNFDRNPRASSSVLLTIDENSGAAPEPDLVMGADHPVAWSREHEGARVFYTNLGHRPETWKNPVFRRHLLEAMRWAAQGGGFGHAVLTRALKNPMALAVTPDNDVYVIERTGEVLRYSAQTGAVTLALKLEVDTAHENGLLGIALDPDFPSDRRVYLYYSAPLADPVPTTGPPGRNVLVSYEAREDGSLDPDTRVELLAVPSERRCCHEGGALAFAPDGTLLLSTGDNTNPFESEGAAPIDGRPGRERFDARRTAANPFDLRGKILRIRRDGTIPAGNLFPPSGELGRPEIYAMGVRNPFRIAADPEDVRLFWGDVGPDAFADSARGPRGYDEINVALAPGDFGWPYCIGKNLPYASFDFTTGKAGPLFDCTRRVPAVVAYDYGTPTYAALGTGRRDTGEFVGRTAVAGAVYRAPADAPFALPPRFAGTLLMAEWARDRLAVVDVDAAGALRSVERFLGSAPWRRPVDIEVARDGAIYVLEYGSGFWGDNPDAALSRVEYAAQGRLSPAARLEASTSSGPAPLEVRFSAAASTAPPGERIVRYMWSADGGPPVESDSPEHTVQFETTGTHWVTLRVATDTGSVSQPVSETVVVGNAAPTVRILAPDPGLRIVPGNPVALAGEAHDPEDGPAPCADLTWNVSLGHDAHAHPVTTLTGCETSFVPDLGDHGDTEGLRFYAIELVYTDRGGPNGEPPLTGRHGIKLELLQ